jgi:hypothetical protein
MVVVALCLKPIHRARAENHLDYKFEDYSEDNQRIKVENHSALLQADLLSWLAVKGSLAYDAISGQTPTGNTPNSGQPLLAELRDIRRAGDFEGDIKLGRSTFSPGISYSKESDYKSIGISGTYTLDFNQKNTTLKLGFSHDFDQVLYTSHMLGNFSQFPGRIDHKDASDLLVGITQLLDPKTVLTANASFGSEKGQLTDTYRGVIFQSQSATLFNEIRPGRRDKQAAFVSLTRFISPLNGSMEASYRFYHDSFGIYAHTAILAWYQKIGKKIVASPSFRFYTQSAASFYSWSQSANVENPQFAASGLSMDFFNSFLGYNFDRLPPEFYSADYRLSQFNSFSYGLGISWQILKEATFDASYERYQMKGIDGVTPQFVYPSANIFTVGLRIFF